MNFLKSFCHVWHAVEIQEISRALGYNNKWCVAKNTPSQRMLIILTNSIKRVNFNLA